MVIEHTTPVIRAPDLSYQDWDGCSEYCIARSTQIVDELQGLSQNAACLQIEILVSSALLSAPNRKALVWISW